MSGFMLHGLGDCTPALHCGCLSRSPREPQPENDRQNVETLDCQWQGGK